MLWKLFKLIVMAFFGFLVALFGYACLQHGWDFKAAVCFMVIGALLREVFLTFEHPRHHHNRRRGKDVAFIDPLDYP